MERTVFEYYDIQKVPTTFPIGYYYFATKDGYTMWAPCATCGATPISTLLMNASVATVNIASPDMKDNVTKALTREEMLSHPTFKKWAMRPYQKEGFIKMREKENINDSKK